MSRTRGISDLQPQPRPRFRRGRGDLDPGQGALIMNPEEKGNKVVQEVLIFLAVVATIFALS